MRSKITIDTASNFKPCIRVSEGATPFMQDSQIEDVRDKLVMGFRELLHHKSNTVQVIFEGSNSDYILMPVEDELRYFEGRCRQIVFPTHDSEEAKRIEEFFNWVRNPSGEKIPDLI